MSGKYDRSRAEKRNGLMVLIVIAQFFYSSFAVFWYLLSCSFILYILVYLRITLIMTTKYTLLEKCESFCPWLSVYL